MSHLECSGAGTGDEETGFERWELLAVTVGPAGEELLAARFRDQRPDRSGETGAEGRGRVRAEFAGNSAQGNGFRHLVEQQLFGIVLREIDEFAELFEIAVTDC